MARVGIITSDPASPDANDSAIKTELESDGNTCTYIDDNDPEIVETTNYDVLIPSGVNFGAYGNRDINFKGGVVLRFAGNAGASGFNLCSSSTSEPSQTQIDIDSPLHNHPVLGGAFSTGLQTVRSVSAAFGTVLTANLASGVRALAQAGSTSENCVLVADKGELDINGNPFVGRRAALCYLNNAQNGTTLGYDGLRKAVKWAAGENAAAAEVVSTIGSGGDYATYSAAFTALDGEDLATVVSGGRKRTLRLISEISDQPWLGSGHSFTVDGDCYFDLDLNGFGIDYTGNLAAGDDIVAILLNHTIIHDGYITHSGTTSGTTTPGSCCKLVGQAHFAKADRLYVHDVTTAGDRVGISAQGGLGQSITNSIVHTINSTESGQDVRGIRSSPAGNSYWPTIIAGNSIADIGNSTTSPDRAEGVEVFVDGNNDDEVHVIGNAVANVSSATTSSACFAFYNNNSGTIVTSHNASDDATADDNGDNPSTHLINQTATEMFVDPSTPASSADLHLADGSVLLGAGTDMTGESALLAFDFDGDTRNTDDIGADAPADLVVSLPVATLNTQAPSTIPGWIDVPIAAATSYASTPNVQLAPGAVALPVASVTASVAFTSNPIAMPVASTASNVAFSENPVATPLASVTTSAGNQLGSSQDMPTVSVTVSPQPLQTNPPLPITKAMPIVSVTTSAPETIFINVDKLIALPVVVARVTTPPINLSGGGPVLSSNPGWRRSRHRIMAIPERS